MSPLKSQKEHICVAAAFETSSPKCIDRRCSLTIHRRGRLKKVIYQCLFVSCTRSSCALWRWILGSMEMLSNTPSCSASKHLGMLYMNAHIIVQHKSTNWIDDEFDAKTKIVDIVDSFWALRPSCCEKIVPDSGFLLGNLGRKEPKLLSVCGVLWDLTLLLTFFWQADPAAPAC